MASNVLYLTGKAYWAKLAADKLDTKFTPNWNLKLELDQESLNRFKQAKLALKLSENDIGELNCITPKRYADKDMKDSEKRSTKLPPRVLLRDGAKMVSYEGLIGNGSRVTVKLDTFDTRYPTKGHRLVAVVIEELLEYSPDDTSGVEPDVPENEIPF